MKFTLLATAALACTLAGPALAQSQPATQVTVETAPGQASATRTTTVVAAVTEVDASKGHITLKSPKGDLIPLRVGPEVRNLAQVKVGDQLSVRYLENLTLTLMKGGKGARGTAETMGGARSKAGDRPAGVVAAQTEFIADVIAVDAKKQTVRLKGPQQTVDLDVPNPEQFKLIKVGDQVHGVYTEALAVSVDPAPAKK